jgi:phosphatidylglycerophosphate synthase
MMRIASRRVWASLAIGIGLVLLIIAIRRTDFSGVIADPGRFVRGFFLALAASAAWQAIRAWMWKKCLARPIAFTRLAQVRIIGEAFSYLTITGVAGDPLKWLLLRDGHAGRDVAPSLIRERLAYLIGTTAVLALVSVWVALSVTLPDNWRNVFFGISLGTGLFTMISAASILGAASLGRSKAGSIISRAINWLAIDTGAGVERQSWRRIAALGLGAVAAFICMVVEVWVVLRAAGIPISVADAVAIETISRVGTFASVLVPANLGVLEISTLSAAIAVGIPTAAAPLGLTRRLRGLFWATVGLALYGRLRAGRSDSKAIEPPENPRVLLSLAAEAPALTPLNRIAGLPIAERVVRAACKAGYDEIIVYAGDHHEALQRLLARICKVSLIRSESSWRAAIAHLPRDLQVTVVGGGVIPSVQLLESALSVDAGDSAAHVPAGDDWPRTGVVRARMSAAVRLSELSRTTSAATPPWSELPSAADVVAGHAHLVLRGLSLDDLAESERTIRLAAYKRTDATVARFNRKLSLPISIALIRTPITANLLSMMLVALGVVSAWLFSRGEYLAAVAAGSLSLAASILDGCDGEIARLKYQESSFGCWLETIGDYAYYIAILFGITIGAARSFGGIWIYQCGIAAAFGTALSFAMLLYLRRRITAGRPDQLHAIAKARFNQQPTWWSRAIWRMSFIPTRAAMPYGIFVLALLGALPAVVVLWAVSANVYWISLCLKLRDLLDRAEVERPVVLGGA